MSEREEFYVIHFAAVLFYPQNESMLEGRKTFNENLTI